jgi:hypothetical protein
MAYEGRFAIQKQIWSVKLKRSRNVLGGNAVFKWTRAAGDIMNARFNAFSRASQSEGALLIELDAVSNQHVLR